MFLVSFSWPRSASRLAFPQTRQSALSGYYHFLLPHSASRVLPSLPTSRSSSSLVIRQSLFFNFKKYNYSLQAPDSFANYGLAKGINSNLKPLTLFNQEAYYYFVNN
jgi:hypothetical protein